MDGDYHFIRLWNAEDQEEGATHCYRDAVKTSAGCVHVGDGGGGGGGGTTALQWKLGRWMVTIRLWDEDQEEGATHYYHNATKNLGSVCRKQEQACVTILPLWKSGREGKEKDRSMFSILKQTPPQELLGVISNFRV